MHATAIYIQSENTDKVSIRHRPINSETLEKIRYIVEYPQPLRGIKFGARAPPSKTKVIPYKYSNFTSLWFFSGVTCRTRPNFIRIKSESPQPKSIQIVGIRTVS